MDDEEGEEEETKEGRLRWKEDEEGEEEETKEGRA